MYIVGSEIIGTVTPPLYMAILWKNGVRANLNEGSSGGAAYSVTVSGTDVYVTGSLNTFAHLWKNGVGANVSDNLRTTGYGLAISGVDAYIVGAESSGGKFVATLWKNSTPTVLPAASVDYVAKATSVAIAGTDVYEAGVEGQGGSGRIVLWKNGVMVNLNSGYANSFDITASVSVLGNDVYIGGSDNQKATLWKNGVATKWSTGDFVAEIRSIFLVPKQ